MPRLSLTGNFRRAAGVPCPGIRPDLLNPGQEPRVLARASDRAVEAKVNPVPVQQIFHTLMEMSEERQRESQGDGNLP